MRSRLHARLSADPQRSRQSPFPAERQASAFGPYYVCIGIAALPSSLVMGYLYQRFGVGPAFRLGAIFAGLSVLPLSILIRPSYLYTQTTV
jgi:hypothetical protein